MSEFWSKLTLNDWEGFKKLIFFYSNVKYIIEFSLKKIYFLICYELKYSFINSYLILTFC